MVTCQQASITNNIFYGHKLKPDCLVLAHKTFTTNLAMSLPKTMVRDIFARARCYL